MTPSSINLSRSRIQFRSRSMSDSTFSDNHFTNKMVWVWTTLNPWWQISGEIQFWDNNSHASCIFFDRTNFERNFNSRIRVDYSITRRAHSPTPGVYLGQKKDKAPKLSPSKREKEISPDRTPVKYPYKGRSRTKSMSPDSIAKRYVTKPDPFLGNS